MARYYLAFYKAHSGIFDFLIRLKTGGDHSHVELVYDGGDLKNAKCFSSSNRDGGVRDATIDLTTGNWDLIELPEPVVDGLRVEMDCQLGKPYDWLGIFGFVAHNIPAAKDQWFCSEIVTTLLQYFWHIAIGAPPARTSPEDLWKIMQVRANAAARAAH